MDNGGSMLYLLCFCRIHLAALKYNENCDRPLILDEEGKEKLRVEFLKYKGGKGKARTVRPERTNSEYILKCSKYNIVIHK